MTTKSDVNFHAPEFDKVFKRIVAMENKEGYYNARLRIQNLESLALSEFADQIRFLNVQIPDDLENLDRLCYASITYFRNIERVDVVFNEVEQFLRVQGKKIRISQRLVFRGLNIFCADKDSIVIFGNRSDVQIIDSKFEGIGLYISTANKITIKSTSFQNIYLYYGLECRQSQNTTTIENVNFLNCQYGLEINSCQNKVTINNIYAKNCQFMGCSFEYINDLILDSTKVADCVGGILCQNTNAIFHNCQITGFKDRSVTLINSTLNYRQIYLKKFEEDVDEDFNTVFLYNSTFEELL